MSDAPNAEYERPHWRLYCRIFGHHWRPMTASYRVWVPIQCARCGMVVARDGSDDA